MRSALLAGLMLVGCVPIYDSQYDDRRRELEAFREEFQPAENDVQVIASGEQRVFWVDKIPPGNQQQMHSMDPAQPSTQIDYLIDVKNESDFSKYRYGSDLILHCSFGSAQAYDATSNSMTALGTLSSGASEDCAVDGTVVYFRPGQTIDRWSPGGAPPATIVTLQDAGVAQGAQGFGVIGNLMVVNEADGDLYTIDTSRTPPMATWLENQEHKAAGNVFFDENGVLFDTINPTGIRYIQFADHQDFSFEDLVDDGGYHLNWKHGDVQVPVEGEFVIHQRHVIYRGQRGIFAYGLDTHNVIDLLLEEGEGIDRKVTYRNPVVTSGGYLFVQSGDSFSSDGPTYRVDLNGRLK